MTMNGARINAYEKTTSFLRGCIFSIFSNKNQHVLFADNTVGRYVSHLSKNCSLLRKCNLDELPLVDLAHLKRGTKKWRLVTSKTADQANLVPWQLLHQLEPPRHAVGREGPSAKVLQRLQGQIFRGRGDDDRGHNFAPSVVIQPKHGGVGHVRVGQKHALNVQGAYLVPS